MNPELIKKSAQYLIAGMRPSQLIEANGIELIDEAWQLILSDQAIDTHKQLTLNAIRAGEIYATAMGLQDYKAALAALAMQNKLLMILQR